MKDGAAETAGVEEEDSLTQGQGEEHSHRNQTDIPGCVQPTRNTCDKV